MKSSSPQPGNLRRGPNFVVMLAAVCAAAVMWYSVSIRDRLEAQVEVHLDYYGIPGNLVVTDGLVNKITVRIRGSQTLVRAMTRERLTVGIDLANIKKGKTTVPLGGEELTPKFRAFEIVDVSPPRIVVTADNLIERSVPVRTIIESPFKGGALTIENRSVKPSTVVLRGPEETVASISYLPLTINLDPKSAGDKVDTTMTLDTPSLVTATPPSVRVSYTITSGRTVVSRLCKIAVAGNMEKSYEVTPSELTALVEVPDAFDKNSSYFDQLKASVAPPPMEAGESRKMRVRIQLPEGMTLLNQSVDEVTVTKIK